MEGHVFQNKLHMFMKNKFKKKKKNKELRFFLFFFPSKLMKLRVVLKDICWHLSITYIKTKNNQIECK